MAIFRYLGKYQAIPFSQVTTSAREHFQAIVCNCVRRQGFSIFFPKSNIARISELPFPPLHSFSHIRMVRELYHYMSNWVKELKPGTYST